MLRVIVMAGLVSGLCWMAPSSAPAAIEAGAAFRVITPEPLLPLSGGAGEPSPAKEKKGELTARALVLRSGETIVAIASADLLGFPGVLCDRVRAKVPRIKPENIIIGSTHCHSAPDTYAFPDEEGNHGADLEYLGWICDRMAEAINEAIDTLQPAALKINTDEARGKIAYNYYAPQLYDPRMSVIQALGRDGKAIATLVNYATHPEVIGSDQGLLSPDLCGPLYDRIQEQGGGMGLFMNGAQGGMVTADCRGPEGGKDIQTWDECVRIGNLMADEALRIVGNAPALEDPGLFCGVTRITFPIDSELMQFIIAKSPLKFPMNDDGSVTAQVNLINLGEAQILTIPGEALPNVGYYLKRKMHGKQNLLFGLTNEAFGYMLAKVDWDSFKRYRYISETCLGEMTAEIYMTEALKFADASPRPATAP